MADDAPLTRRERQAQQTREEILRSARRLFAQQGYARTTVRQIAEGAGVSAQTVYDSVGSKQALVARLNDSIDEEAQIGRIIGPVMASGDPTEIAALPARVSRAILEHCGDIVQALITGAEAEPELEAALEEGHRRHMAGSRMVVGSLQGAGALAPGLDPEEAATAAAALADPTFGLLLRDRYGWSFDQMEAWVSDLTRTLLLSSD